MTVGVAVLVGVGVGGTAVAVAEGVALANICVGASSGVGGMGRIERVGTSVGSGSTAAKNGGGDWQAVKRTAVINAQKMPKWHRAFITIRCLR